MDRVSKSMWQRRKNKGLRSGDVEEVIETQTRTINWSKLESDDLLNSARDVQLERGRNDLNFTKPEMAQVYRLFCERSPGTTRTQDHAVNKLRTMRKEFNIFHELASKSGWGWDFDNHIPRPPSQQMFKELCQNEAQYKYFDTKTYQWYSQMLTMSGGRLARGNTRQNTFSGQNNIARSGTDSSDPGNEEPLPNEVEETIQQPNSTQSPDTIYNRQSSQRDASMSSGSGKRKSTEDDGDGLTRRQKIQKRLSARGKGFERMAEIVLACCILHNFINDANRLNQVSDIAQFDVPVEHDVSFGDNFIMAGLGHTDNSVGDELRVSIMNELWNI